MKATIMKKDLVEMYKKEFANRLIDAKRIDETREDQAWGRDKVEWNDGSTHIKADYQDPDDATIIMETHDDRFNHHLIKTEMRLQRNLYGGKRILTIKETEEEDKTPTTKLAFTLEEEQQR